MERPSSGIFLKNCLIKSKAWLSLGNTAMQMFLIFRIKCQMWESRGKGKAKSKWLILNNGKIVFTYVEAEDKYDISAGRFDRGLTELVEKGFIDIAGTGQGKYKSASNYSISDRWRNYDTDEFKPGQRKKARPFKVGFRKGNKLGKNCKRKFSTVTRNNGSTVTHNNGTYTAMRTDNNGRKIRNLYKQRNGKWLDVKIA